MSSRDLHFLNKFVFGAAIKHVQLCASQGIELLIFCTLRPNEEQAALYSKGRTTPGKIVTNAKPGESAHNPDALGESAAYDCVPVVHGKPIWDTEDPVWEIVGKCGEEAGLVWSGRWTGSLREMAHFQDPKWVKPSERK